MKVISDKAYSQGYVAGEVGLPSGQLTFVNPYDAVKEPIQHGSWMEGYEQGFNDYLFERQKDRYSTKTQDITFILLMCIVICFAGIAIYNGVQYIFG